MFMYLLIVFERIDKNGDLIGILVIWRRRILIYFLGIWNKCRIFAILNE